MKKYIRQPFCNLHHLGQKKRAKTQQKSALGNHLLKLFMTKAIAI